MVEYNRQLLHVLRKHTNNYHMKLQYLQKFQHYYKDVPISTITICSINILKCI